MKLRVSIFAFFISTIAIAQPPEKLATHEDSIRILKQLIRERELVASAAVGFALQPAPQWYSFAYLLSLSTNDEVLQMTKDSSACYDFTPISD